MNEYGIYIIPLFPTSANKALVILGLTDGLLEVLSLGVRSETNCSMMVFGTPYLASKLTPIDNIL